jgi:tetratricopeptide (TPR) repeat protein
MLASRRMGDWDTWTERVLMEHGAVDAAAVRHARALQRRGFEHDTLEELLVDLGHVSGELVAQALAAATSVPLLGDEEVDPVLVRGARRGRPAVPLRLEGNTLVYATTRPQDEALGDELRFATSAARAVARVATERALARLRRRVVAADSAPEVPAAAPTPGRRASPEELLAEWEEAERHPEREDSPLVRLTNVLLLEHVVCAPGYGVRIELFEEPRIRAGAQSCYGDAAPQFWNAPAVRSLLDPISRRLQFMAVRDVAADEVEGWIHLSLGAHARGASTRVRVRKTARGRVMIAERQAPWHGRPGDAPALRRWLAHMIDFMNARGAGRLEGAERAARAAISEAEVLGAEAELELVSSLMDLARFLDQSQREAEAAPLAARALELCRSLGLGPRVEGEIAGLLGNTTLDDLERRLGFFARARNLLDLPGVGREPIAHVACAMSQTELELERPERALAFAEEAHANDIEWFGAETAVGHAALVEASAARSALGDVERARVAADAARRIGEALGVGTYHAEWAHGRASLAAGELERALPELRRAAADPEPESFTAMRARADLALVLEQIGDITEARELGTSTLATLEPLGAICARSRRALEEMLRRAGPYR